MEIKFYGHACIYIKTSSVSIVTDPWFSISGAFLSTWFQFPDNTELDLTPLRNVDYVVLSHEHQDHFDIDFLKTINPRTKIIIPKYTDSYLLETLQHNLTNEIIIVNSLQKIKLGSDVTFCPVVQSVPIWDDCTLVFETPLGTIVDVNDMKIIDKDFEWIKNNFTINHLFIQYSGANWHPFTYDYSSDKKAEIAKQKILNKYHTIKNLFLQSGAQNLIPCAGPPCFLSDEHFELNFSDESVFPTQADFYEFLKREGVYKNVFVLMPGDTFDPSKDSTIISEINIRNQAFVNKRKYIESYRERRTNIINKIPSTLEQPTGSLLVRCKNYFEPLVASSLYFRKKINGKLLLIVTGGINEKIIIDFTKEKDSVKLFENESSFYKLEVDSRLFNLILEKKLTWEELFLSLRIRCSRNPDIYNEALIIFLRFADVNSYKQYEMFDLKKDFSDTFILNHEGCSYEVQKYCPHAMGDLSAGRIIDGCIVCPNHGWAFSLKDGSCVSRNSNINIKKIIKS